MDSRASFPRPGAMAWLASLRHRGGLIRLWAKRCSLTDGPSMVAVAYHGSPVGSRESNERPHHRVPPQHVQHGNFQNGTRDALKYLEGRPPRYVAQFSREDLIVNAAHFLGVLQAQGVGVNAKPSD